MNILADLHHGSLYHSFQMMADRLGATLYRPAGIEWFDQGKWLMANVYPSPRDTASQFLSVDPAFVPPDGTPVLNNYESAKDGIYMIHDTVHNCLQRGITLDAFNRMPFDVIISSVACHDDLYARLAKEKGAKHIAQTGNIHQRSNAVNQLVSNGLIPTQHHVKYHPEFELNLFRFEKPPESKRITTFLNCLKFHREDYKQWLLLKKELPWDMKSYGGQCDDGGLHEIATIAEEFRKSNFIWHCKSEGDGYGFVVHYAFATGRPLIINYNAYADKPAGELMKHGETIIDMGQFNPSGLAKYVTELLNDRPRYEAMCERVRAVFDEKVNFAKEFIDIQRFFNNLI